MLSPAVAGLPRPIFPATRLPLVDCYRTALFDLDGVVYRGAVAVPAAVAALNEARRRGLHTVFVTNNASRTPTDVVALLTRLGLPTAEHDVVTSAQAAANLAATCVPAGSRVLVVGGPSLEIAVRESGLRPVRSAREDPVAVVQGFAPEVDWVQLAEASYAVARGLPWIASNMDIAVPREGGMAPGNGALVNVVGAVTGRSAIVAGKPQRAIFDEAARRGLRPHLVVGDGLATDIEGANRSGLDSLLVLSGVTTLRDLLVAPAHHRPTYLGVDLGDLLRPQPALRQDRGQFLCGRWAAHVERTEVVLGCLDDEAAALADGARVLCAATWDGTDAGRRFSTTGALQQWLAHCEQRLLG